VPLPSWRRLGPLRAAALALGLAFLGTAWLAGQGTGRAYEDEGPTGSLVDVVDTTALTLPAARESVDATPSPGRQRGSGAKITVAEPDPLWLARVAGHTGIPVVALRAYGRASVLAASELPHCHLGWTTIAAIGEVESAHGSVGRTHLLQDGRSSTAIIGPALDGHDGVAAMRSDAAGAQLHGDATWEHAVGPMQFLPSSWARYGADADGDGVADPGDIDDAAWAAARHLCAGGSDLRTGRAWTQAVRGYNASDAYVLRVYEVAQGYARSAARR